MDIMLNEQKPSSIRERFRQISDKNKSLQEETTAEYLKRNSSQLGARAFETVAGLPGNLQKAYYQFQDTIPQLKELKEQGEQIFGKSNDDEFSLSKLPTSQDIRENLTPEVSKNLFGNKEYLEPHGKGEEVAGNLAQDITSFFMPGTGQLRLATRLGAPILGNLTKEGLKYLGVEESNAEKAKLGTMLITSIAGQSQPKEFANQRISQAKQMIPDTASVNAIPLSNRLLPLYNRLNRGLNVPSKSRAMQGMRDLANQVQGNRINLRSVMDARDNVNEWIAEAGGWDVPRPTRDAAIRNINELKTQIIRTIDENMAQRFPDAGELYRTGYEAAAVNHRSNAISNFVEKNFGRKTASVGAKLLFPSIAGSAAIFPKAAVGGALAFPIYKTGQIAYRVANSPTLARYYSDVLNYSLQGNTPAMVKSLAALDKKLAKDEENNKAPYISDQDRLQLFKQRFKNKG